MIVVVSPCGDDRDRHGRERGCLAGRQQHGRLEEVGVAQAEPGSARQLRAARRSPSVPVHDEVGLVTIAAGPSGERPRRRPRSSAPSAWQLAQRRKASRSVVSSPPNSAALSPRAGEARRDRGALVDVGRGPDLEHLAPPVRGRPASRAAAATCSSSARGAVLVGGAAAVEGPDRVLVLEPDAERPAAGRRSASSANARTRSASGFRPGRPRARRRRARAARGRGCRRR